MVRGSQMTETEKISRMGFVELYDLYWNQNAGEYQKLNISKTNSYKEYS